VIDALPISIIVLVAHERPGLDALPAALDDPLDDRVAFAEIVFAISDRAPRALGSVERIRLVDPRVRTLVLSHWFDAAAAVERALPLTTAPRIVTLEPDTITDLGALTALVEQLKDAEVAVLVPDPSQGPLGVVGRALDRRAMQLFGAEFRTALGGLCAYRRTALAALADRSVPFALQPLLAAWQGQRVAALARPLSRRGRGLPTTLTRAAGASFLYLLLSFTGRPLQLFGAVGALALASGSAIALPLIFARLVHGEALADEPALMPSLLLVALGVQCAALGLLAELLVFVRNHSLQAAIDDRQL
jgi:hypothetical protein